MVHIKKKKKGERLKEKMILYRQSFVLTHVMATKVLADQKSNIQITLLTEKSKGGLSIC